jgi:hypothetical protein
MSFGANDAATAARHATGISAAAFCRFRSLAGTGFVALHNELTEWGGKRQSMRKKRAAPGTNRGSLRCPLTLEGGHMQDYQAQRLLNYRLDWRALFIWTFIIVGCSLAGIAFVLH